MCIFYQNIYHVQHLRCHYSFKIFPLAQLTLWHRHNTLTLPGSCSLQQELSYSLQNNGIQYRQVCNTINYQQQHSWREMWILILFPSSIFNLFFGWLLFCFWFFLLNPNIVFPSIILILKCKALQIRVLHPHSLESKLLLGSCFIPFPMLFSSWSHKFCVFSFPLSQWIHCSSGYVDLKVLNVRKTLKIGFLFPLKSKREDF